jgi:pimeloyl-ACP methyl ester carboxylesterase
VKNRAETETEMRVSSQGQATIAEERPVEERWAVVDGYRMRYLRSGGGRALVLVHGLLGYSFSWRYALPVLAKQATVYAVDMPSGSSSDWHPDMDCSLRANAGRLLRFLESLGLETCDLLGTSYGGSVAMMAAALEPARVRRLILVGPVDPWSRHGSRLAAFLSQPMVSAIFLRLAPRLRFTYRYWLGRVYGDKRRIRAGVLEGYAAPFSTPHAFEYELAVLRLWDQGLGELESLMPGIAHIPTLLMWGSKDRTIRTASTRRLGGQFEDCRIVVLDGVGHLPYEEVPEEFNRVIAGFLSESSSSL